MGEVVLLTKSISLKSPYRLTSVIVVVVIVMMMLIFPGLKFISISRFVGLV